MGRDAIVDVYAEFLGGRSQYGSIKDISDLKYNICERINRDVTWDTLILLVNDRTPPPGYLFQDGDVVKIFPSRKPQRDLIKPFVDLMEQSSPLRRVSVMKVCPRCNGPRAKTNAFQKEESCIYCGGVIEIV